MQDGAQTLRHFKSRRKKRFQHEGKTIMCICAKSEIEEKLLKNDRGFVSQLRWWFSLPYQHPQTANSSYTCMRPPLIHSYQPKVWVIYRILPCDGYFVSRSHDLKGRDLVGRNFSLLHAYYGEDSSCGV